MAPSNKQLDSSFCFASLLLLCFDRPCSTCLSSRSSGDYCNDSMALVNRLGTLILREQCYACAKPFISFICKIVLLGKKRERFFFIKPNACRRMSFNSVHILSFIIVDVPQMSGPEWRAIEFGSILNLKSKVAKSV